MLVKLKWGRMDECLELKDGWMPGVEAYEGDLQVNLLKWNTLLQLWLCSPNKVFQFETRAQIAKANKRFDHRTLHKTPVYCPSEFIFHPHLISKRFHLCNCMRQYLLGAKKPQACSRSLEKPQNSFEPLCYGFFSVDTEYVRQYQQFGTIHLLVKHFGQGLVPSRSLRDWCASFFFR